jgi:ATP-dependent protease HslVU (ClpYQ) peptidase subunit
MSALLQEAIVDATALREAALKTAEASIIEKYSGEVRDVLDNILEQEEDPLAALGADPAAAPAPDPLAGAGMDLGLGAEAGAAPVEEVAEDVPLGAADGEKLCGCPEQGEQAKVSVNLDELQEAVETLHKELNEDQEIEITPEEIAAMFEEEDVSENITTGSDEIFGSQEDAPQTSGGGALAGSAAATEADTEALKSEEGVKEELEISDELLDAIAEKLTVDMGATLSGWAGRSAYDMKWEMEKEMAHRRGTKAHDELEILKKAQEELVFENNQLKERTEQYEQAFKELRENLQEVNVSNARLLYTNRVLRNTSLNERQKTKIAEAISRAGSVAEAKTIYETLESAVPAQTKRAPQSLSEAISRPSSVIRATRKESAQPTDPFLDRMQKLAGIK